MGPKMKESSFSLAQVYMAAGDQIKYASPARRAPCTFSGTAGAVYVPDDRVHFPVQIHDSGKPVCRDDASSDQERERRRRQDPDLHSEKYRRRGCVLAAPITLQTTHTFQHHVAF